MKLPDELRQLQEMHQSGALTDEEFVQAKAKALSIDTDGMPLDETALHRRLQEIEHQNALIQLDHEWEQERESFMVNGRPPNHSICAQIIVLGTILSVLMCVPLAISGSAGGFCALLGLVTFVCCLWVGILGMQKADEYDAAYARYQERRAQLLAQQDRDASS